MLVGDQLIEKAPVIVLVLDADGRIVSYNPYAERVLGYRLAEVKGRDWFDTFHPQDERERWRSIYCATVHDVQTRGQVLALTARDGSRRHVGWYDTTLRDAAGKTTGILAIGLDVTDRWRAEEALRTSESRSRAVLDAVPDLIVRMNRDGTYLDVIAGTEDILAAPADDLMGRTMEEVGIPGPLVEQTLAAIRRALDTGQIQTFEYALDVLMGRRDFEARVVPCAGDETLCIIRDITDRKRAEKEALRANKLESIALLAAGLAHDFNNLLSVILGNISLAETAVEPASPVAENLADAQTACRRARDLTQQLLTFSEGGAPLRRPIDLCDAVREAATIAVSDTNVTCRFLCPDALWPVEADEVQIRQVVTNLVHNAVQAMPGGGTVTIRAQNVVETGGDARASRRRYVRLSIEDQGGGIPDDNLDRIFDPFFTTRPDSSGLGLSIVHSIVRQHEGRIHVTSRMGAGTTVHVSLPAAQPREPVGAAAADEAPAGSGRILVMDDEAFIRKTASAMLKHLGYEAEVAADGNEAVELCRQAIEAGRPFDAVILDLVVPGTVGGRRGIKQLRELDPAIKAIVSSGYSNDPVLARFRDYGFDGVVAKPYDVGELAAVLRSVLGPPRNGHGR